MPASPGVILWVLESAAGGHPCDGVMMVMIAHNSSMGRFPIPCDGVLCRALPGHARTWHTGSLGDALTMPLSGGLGPGTCKCLPDWECADSEAAADQTWHPPPAGALPASLDAVAVCGEE